MFLRIKLFLFKEVTKKYGNFESTFTFEIFCDLFYCSIIPITCKIVIPSNLNLLKLYFYKNILSSYQHFKGVNIHYWLLLPFAFKPHVECETQITINVLVVVNYSALSALVMRSKAFDNSFYYEKLEGLSFN